MKKSGIEKIVVSAGGEMPGRLKGRVCRENFSPVTQPPKVAAGDVSPGVFPSTGGRGDQFFLKNPVTGNAP